GGIVTRSQSDARAAHDVAALAGVEVTEERRPEERDHGPVSEVGMHAGPADLDRVHAQGAELAQVELALRVEAAGAPRAIGGKDAIGSDQRAAPPLAHDEVVTEWIEVVAVEAVRATGDASLSTVDPAGRPWCGPPPAPCGSTNTSCGRPGCATSVH